MAESRYLYISFFRTEDSNRCHVTIRRLHKDESEEGVRHVLRLETPVGEQDLESWAREALAEIIEAL